MKLEYHEYANIYRMLSDDEIKKLAENIKTMGQLLPITSYEGKILDGRNRYKACEIAGVEPRIEEYTGDDPLSLIASLNDHRRHDSDNERAMVGARMANLKRGDVGRGGLDRPTGRSNDQPAITTQRAAELSGSSVKNIQRAKPIVQSGIPELQDMVDSGEVSIRAGSEVAKLPEEEQHKAVAGGVDGVKEAAKKSKQSSASSENSSVASSSTNHQTTAKTNRIAGYVPNDAEELWTQARARLNNILPSDISREKVLREIISYCEKRIEAKK